MMSRKRFLFFVTPVIGTLLLAPSLILAEEKVNSRGQLDTEAQAFNTLSEEFSILRKVLDGFHGSYLNNLLWNHADDIVVLDSTLFQKDSFEGIVPAIYFSLNQQDTLSSIKLSTIGIGLLFYLNR